MRLTRTTALLFVVLVAVPAAAQRIGDSHILPVVGHAQCPGDPLTTWRADVTLYNVADASITVGVQFFPEGQSNMLDPTSSGQRSLTLQLAAHGTKTPSGVIATLGYTNGSKGLLYVTCSLRVSTANPQNASMVVTSRTYNTGSNLGTVGQTVPSDEQVINTTGALPCVTGARQDSRFRSNLGIVGLSQGGTITVHYRRRNGAGSALAEGAKYVPPGSMGQWAFADLGVPNTAGPLTVELWLDPADVIPDPCSAGPAANTFVAHVSKVDGNPQGTGDAEFILAVPAQRLSCD